MRVLFSELTAGDGGSSLSLLHLLRALDRARVQPVVVTLPENRRYAEFAAAGAVVHTADGSPPRPEALPVRTAAHGGLRAAVQDSGLYRALSARRRHRGAVAEPGAALAERWAALCPDLVYVNHGLVNGAPGVEAARRLGVPCICHERGFAIFHAPHRTLARTVSHFVCISRAVEAHVRASGITRTTVIHNGIDLEAFDPGRAPDVPASVPRPAGPLLVSTGRLTRWKGLHVLLDALPRVFDKVPDAGMVVAGEGEERGALERRAARLGIGEAVHFAGFLPDVRGLVRAADVLVHSAVEPEPFGRTVLEGLALGVPVVAVNLGGVPEIVEDGVHGLLVPPGAPEPLAEAILRILGDAGLRERLRAAGRERAGAFDHRLTAERVGALLAAAGGTR
jgi:glycosyltransferase involved in cell wall biosynthesis